MSEGVSESLFYMWRTLFALAHADDLVSDEEVRFMAEAFEDVPFSEEQASVLHGDMREPQDVANMFMKVTEPVDQAKFFELAREMVWVDGNFGPAEQAVMTELQKMHIADTDLEDLVGKVDMALDDDEGEDSRWSGPKAPAQQKSGFFGFISKLFGGT